MTGGCVSPKWRRCTRRIQRRGAVVLALRHPSTWFTLLPSLGRSSVKSRLVIPCNFRVAPKIQEALVYSSCFVCLDQWFSTESGRASLGGGAQMLSPAGEGGHHRTGGKKKIITIIIVWGNTKIAQPMAIYLSIYLSNLSDSVYLSMVAQLGRGLNDGAGRKGPSTALNQLQGVQLAKGGGPLSWYITALYLEETVWQKTDIFSLPLHSLDFNYMIEGLFGQ